jgi:hypothetical protein
MAVANFSYSHIWALSYEISKVVEVYVLLEQGQTLGMEVQEYALGSKSVCCIINHCYFLYVVAHLNHHGGELITRENVHVKTSVHLH